MDSKISMSDSDSLDSRNSNGKRHFADDSGSNRSTPDIYSKRSRVDDRLYSEGHPSYVSHSEDSSRGLTRHPVPERDFGPKEYPDPRAGLDLSVRAPRPREPARHIDVKVEKRKEEEKENLMEDGPMDLSTCSKKPTSPDVIMLSDSDDELKINGHNDLKNGDWKFEKNKLVKKLQEDLRNEEAKLVLLKKLRQSQQSHPIQESNSNNSTKPHQNRQPSVPPPPLVRGSGSSSGSTSIQKQHMSQMSRSSPHQSSSRSSQIAPPPLVMAPRMQHPSQSSMRGSSSHSSTPPNLIQGYRGMSGQSSSMSSNHRESRDSAADNQTPGQRQAAAKLALRKQLEKTLLQIPPPKPPPPEMNFIPSLASNEFIMLVGLEEVVKIIIDIDAISRGLKSQDVKYVFNPFTCVQCGTDFTPVWKRDKPGSKNVICEQCVTSNQKKALKQEHTNRLKSAFVKALQQEQEIEQRMQAQPSSSSQPESRSSSSSGTSNPVNLSNSYKASASQLTHQNLIQAHQAQLGRQPQLAGLHGFGHRLPFPFPYNKTDLQRQYLLDMIPSRALHPSQMQWKS